MIVPFWGELLFHKIPLELSFNPCSHGCAYCFNILNGMNKHCDMAPLTKLLTDFNNRETFVAKLLKKGYPVLMSNRSDPFARSNYEQALSIIKLMSEVGIPMAFQTKGGYGIDEALDMLDKPTCWYITITHSSDQTRKIFERNAPDIDSRFTLCEKLRSKGHRVQVGINPMVREWLGYNKQLASFIERLKNSGVEGIWAEKIHFNRKQIKNISPKVKIAFGDIINEGLKNPSPELTEYIDTLQSMIKDSGIVFGSSYNWNTKYWDVFDETYDTLFPNTIDFIRHCFNSLEDDTVIAYSYFKRHIVDKFPKGRYNIKNYILNKGFRMNKKYALKSQMTFDEIMRIMWFDPKAGKMGIGVKEWFAVYGCEITKDGFLKKPVCEDYGMPYYMFRRSEFNSSVVDLYGKEVLL